MSDPLKAVADKSVADKAPDERSLGSASDDDLQTEHRPAANEPPASLEVLEDRAPIDEAAKALALAIAEAADDRKGGNINVLQVGDISYLADYFVIVTGFSKVQVRAIANSIEDAVEEKFERLPLRTEGMNEGRWVLKDYGEVIVHIFMPDDREYYDLEAFWGHAERIEFVPTPLS